MNGYLRGSLLAALSGVALALAGCGGGGGGGNPPGASAPTVVVRPLLPLPGPYAVACSNVVQDFNRLGAGEDATSYWEGNPSVTGMPRYATDLLADPDEYADRHGDRAAGLESLRVVLPGRMSRSWCSRAIPRRSTTPVPTIRCGPTGKVVPHMQTGSDPPLFADNSARYPVVAFSHGYSGSPLSSDYISALSVFASYGYVVVAPFHGDLRFSDLTIDNLSDAIAVAVALGATSRRCRRCDPFRSPRRSTSCSRIRNGEITSMRHGSAASGRAWAARR